MKTSTTLTLATVLAVTQAQTQSFISNPTSSFASATAAANITSAFNNNFASLPTSVAASSVFADDFSSSAPSWATGAYYTSLASAIYEVDKSFFNNPSYTSIENAIYSAAAAAGTGISASMDSSQWYYDQITTNSWYSNVPTSVQTAVNSYVSAFNAAESSVSNVAKAQVTGGAGATSTSQGAAAGPRVTGMAVLGAAAGVVAGVVAAL